MHPKTPIIEVKRSLWHCGKALLIEYLLQKCVIARFISFADQVALLDYELISQIFRCDPRYLYEKGTIELVVYAGPEILVEHLCLY